MSLGAAAFSVAKRANAPSFRAVLAQRFDLITWSDHAFSVLSIHSWFSADFAVQFYVSLDIFAFLSRLPSVSVRSTVRHRPALQQTTTKSSHSLLANLYLANCHRVLASAISKRTNFSTEIIISGAEWWGH